MSKKQYDAAKKRLGVADKPQAESQAKDVAEGPVMDENIVLDDDGFLVGVKVQAPAAERGSWVLNDGKFAGCPVQYRALLSIDHQMLRGSPVTRRMVELGKDSRDIEEQDKFLASLSAEEINRIYTESAKLMVIEAVEKPMLTNAPSERCPPNRISIQDISLTDILNLRLEIERLSGVSEKEETFPEADEADSADTDESESGSTVEPNDSGVDSEGVGESAE